MAGNRRIRPPNGLEARGRRLWREVLGDHDLTPAEREVLAEACRTADTCDALAGVLERDGLEVKGSAGQPRTHPALAELRGQRAQLAALLSQLGLDSDGRGVESTATVRARRAARSRWDRHLRAVTPPATVSRYEHLKGPGDGAGRPA